MGSDFLKEIVAHKRTLLEGKKAYFDNLKKNINKAQHSQYHIFKKAISKPGQINLIAEIKKASPSKGLIREDFDVGKLAKIYVDNGAAALSILTEEKYFLGKPEYLAVAADRVNVPLLTKDFIIDDNQIYEAFFWGASAVLLIVAILKDAELKHLRKEAAHLGLDCLVEVHDEQELDRALKADCDIIGINNRNLHTLKVDTRVSEQLIPRIPKDKVIVAESGLSDHKEIKRLKDLKAHAVLIGETFLKVPDPGKKVKEVMYGQS